MTSSMLYDSEFLGIWRSVRRRGQQTVESYWKLLEIEKVILLVEKLLVIES